MFKLLLWIITKLTASVVPVICAGPRPYRVLQTNATKDLEFLVKPGIDHLV